MSTTPPDSTLSTKLIATKTVVDDPNRKVTFEKHENKHGEFLRIIERRNNRDQWVCIPMSAVWDVLDCLREFAGV